MSLDWAPLGTLDNTHQKQAAALSVNMRSQNKHQLVVLYNCDQRYVLDTFPGQFPWMTHTNDNKVDPRTTSTTRKLMSSDLGIKLCQNCPLSKRDLQLRCSLIWKLMNRNRCTGHSDSFAGISHMIPDRVSSSSSPRPDVLLLAFCQSGNH